MADRRVDHLLVGGGLASASCARWLREEGAEGSILLVGREFDPPYNRPPLTKEYLRGEESRSDVLYRPDEWWQEQRIELLTRTSVMKLDTAERVATLSTKETVAFDTALIATGANVHRLRAPGSELEGIHYIRALANVDSLMEDAAQSEHVVLIGGSYIACEVAASLTASAGVRCSLVMQEEEPLERHFGTEAGRFFRRILEEHGVEIHGRDELARFEGGGDRVGKVVTGAGLELECDCVVIGAGVVPEVTLARSAGIELGETGGLRCSSGLETSVPGVYAAGDNCEYDSPVHGRRLRVEHWDVANNQGKTAALNMLGRGVEHTVVPYFFSDLADWAFLEYVGPGSGEPVVRGSMEEGKFSVFYLEGERVTATLAVGGRSDDLEHGRRFITHRSSPSRDALADEGTDLSTL